MTEAKMLVFSNAVEGQDDAFNEWYDTTHLADVVKVPGISAGQRYDLVPGALPGRAAAAPAHRYLAVYDLTAEPAEVVAEFTKRAGSGEIPLSPTLDVASLSVAVWKPRGEAVTG
ncbi:hypothetical protein AB0H71_19625 [Nocardia sp. NPDC050697]|uniref:hypothetical protein n=1 Tax=Nocardia sp. NPDC050697 TaxID=3155158 RepID=UPI0033D25860